MRSLKSPQRQTPNFPRRPFHSLRYSVYSISHSFWLMEEDTDVLDWGNEDDEQQNHELHRKGFLADGDTNRGDADDGDDAVSLGDDEDEQELYTFSNEDSNGNAVEGKDSNAKPTSTPKSDIFPNQQQQQPPSSRDTKREDSATSQKFSSATQSPQRGANNQHKSPDQRLATRLTHALPPKPIVAPVTFFPPSHPSIVEATSMTSISRSTGRSESHKVKRNGASTTTVTTGLTSGVAGGGKSAPADRDPHSLPPEWEARSSRGGDGTYYYNSITHESTWVRPTSSSSPALARRDSRNSSSRRHRGGSMSPGGRPRSPRADHVYSQASRPGRAQPPLQLDIDMTDSHKATHGLTAAQVPSADLSYEDRHYRPGGGVSAPAPTEARRADRILDEVDPRFNPNPQYGFTPPASPRPRDFEPERSLPSLHAPPPAHRGRESRSSRGSQRSGRGARHTNADPSMQKQHESGTDAPMSSARAWGQPPLTSYDSSRILPQGAPRQQHRQDPFDSDVASFEGSAHMRENRERPPMSGNASVRGRNREREREPSRTADAREQLDHSKFPNTHSTLSASHHPPLHLPSPCTAAIALQRWRASLSPRLSLSVVEALRLVLLSGLCSIHFSWLLPPLLLLLVDSRTLIWTPSISFPPLFIFLIM